jgi:hypothetical protein
MFNFKSLIKQFGKVNPKLITHTDGYYDYENGGQWVDGEETQTEFEGAVVPHSENVLKDNLVYTADDKKLYCYLDLDPNAKVSHKDIMYTVMEKRDYADFDSDLRIYTLKRGGKNE